MGRKKIVLIVVEGPSDRTALEGPLAQVFTNAKVKACVVHGDITTQSGISSQNIIRQLESIVKVFLARNFLKKTDIIRLIHVVDMDGAYISDDRVTENVGLEKTQYTEDGIVAHSKENILIRNQQKRQNLDRLIQLQAISYIPYQIFYMSCNLDHALYGKLNLSDREKEDLAYAFAEYYVDSPEKFKQFIGYSPFSVLGTYQESWDFIKKEMNSLHRHTNLGVSFAM